MLDEMQSARRAKALLATLRQTPMLRGGRAIRGKRQLKDAMSGAFEAEGVLMRLAQRIAFQLVLKFDVAELGEADIWQAVSRLLQEEIERLKTGVGLVDRQIIVALPKLSPDQIEGFVEELRASDPRIARTVFNAALDAAEPLGAGRRYLAAYRGVAEQLKTIAPGVARTLANATFMARVPRSKAIDHLRWFADLVMKFQDNVDFVRTLARAACRAPNPLKAAERLMAEHDAIVAEFVSTDVEPHIARTLAAIASIGADPKPTAYKLLQNFRDVVDLVKRTHPLVARTIALSACRAADPLGTAQSYTHNYDTIVRLISRTDPQRAHAVALQTFRTNHPVRWAKRYLATLQTQSRQMRDTAADRT